jgi:DNA-binding transcriptional LysR family regulator
LFDRLKHAADEQHRSVRQVRLGTVNAATAPLLAPAIRQFRQSHPQTQVEVTPVVVLRADSPLAGHAAVRTADLLAEPLIVMRSGYVMHRYLHRLLQGRQPSISYSTDGAELGKLMVAEGLGLTVLPDFSVIGDPLEQHGVITWRPLADDHTGVELVIHRPRSGSPPLAARDLHRIFVERARAYSAAHA